MTASPDDRTDPVADAVTPPQKKAPARKTPAKRAPAPRTPARSAADKAAATVEVVAEPVSKPGAGTGAAATGGTAPTGSSKSTAAKSTAAKSTAAKTTAAKTTAAKTAAAKRTTSRTSSATARTAAARSAAAKASGEGTEGAKTAARTTTAKTAAAKAAAEKSAAQKSTARTTAARTAADRTAAAKKAAATRAAKAAAAKAEAEARAAREDATPEVEEVAMIATEPPVEATPVEIEPAAAAPVEAPAATEDVVATEEPAATDAPAAAEEPARTDDAVVTDDAVGIEESAPTDEAAAIEDVVPVVDGAAAEEPTSTGAAASATEAIRIRGLVKSFGDHIAVNGVDLTVPAGSFYGIVGPNGAGKTTTLSIVAGLLRSDSGEVVICGVDQRSNPLAAKRMMGVLPDRLRTFDRLTGRQLLYYYGLLRGLASDVIEKRVGDLARAFDLGDALGRVVSDYSAGMTKKIMLAGAMIHSPRVLVLDEPFEAVDPVSSAVILDILRAYVAHGGTVILSSHGMDLVERVCSRVAIIVGGDVLAEGTIDEVRAGQTLEARFVELSGGIGEVEGLEWLHTFSD
ncbi:ATP-binding cassette domain-containing protein [Microbacterium maritypicum]